MVDYQDEEVRRLSGRTVDNLRSLYSVLFALSFGLALTGTYEKVHTALVGQVFDPVSLGLHALVSLSFLVTLGLFHHQTDRYLDVVYRRDGLLGVQPLVFLLDLVRGLVSMAPIYLMAQSLGAEPYRQVGFTWYVLSGALFLLSNTMFLSWTGLGRNGSAAAKAGDGDAGDRVDALRVFWLLLNSASMVLLFVIYRIFRSAGEVCPARGEAGLQVGFLSAFCILLLARNLIDISQSWPVLHPAFAGPGASNSSRLLAWLGPARRRRRTRWVALLLALAAIALSVQAGLLDIFAVTRNCMTR
ncbi:MAG: hypothetical protein ACKOD3_05800 [Phenylobacterium sp.]